jgi:hypothetical protein
MGNKRRDRTGDEYGSFTVLGEDPDNWRLWLGRWGCCGREQSVSVERCGVLMRTVPHRCIRCVKEGAMDNPEYTASRAAHERERRAAKKMEQNRPSEVVLLVVYDKAGWPWPELGRMGPRGG